MLVKCGEIADPLGIDSSDWIGLEEIRITLDRSMDQWIDGSMDQSIDLIDRWLDRLTDP